MKKLAKNRRAAFIPTLMDDHSIAYTDMTCHYHLCKTNGHKTF